MVMRHVLHYWALIRNKYYAQSNEPQIKFKNTLFCTETCPQSFNLQSHQDMSLINYKFFKIRSFAPAHNEQSYFSSFTLV